MALLTVGEWEAFTKSNPKTHILQTAPWGELKTGFGWSPRYIRLGEIGAMVLFRRLPLGMSVAYIPRGPVGADDWVELWPAMDDLCKQEKAVFLRVEPNLWEPVQNERINRLLPGFAFSSVTIQPPRTILINLESSEEEILNRMKSKTRYNIRLAKRKGVEVSQSTDVAGFHAMSLTTGARDVFGVHNLLYYQRVYDLFSPSGECALFLAYYEDQPLAGLMVFTQSETAWYFYGASTNKERNRMPTYLLQWEAIRWAKQKGCKVYDMWGIPDFPEDELEDQFMTRSDGLWGVYRFKRGFGGKIVRTVGAWDRVYRPMLYKLYELLTHRIKPSAA
jgi:lipid II:glycine glycyltransferase (peptidoglycan interpeptide bridge formation enzyme)